MFKNFTHLETNLTILPEVALDKHLKIILNGQMPSELLPNILHEITHHWTFLSPVGNTLALLYQRMILASLYHPTAERMVNFKIGYECVSNFLRPLSEGISLFMEHDALPSKGDVRVSPFQLLYLISQGREESMKMKTMYEMDPAIRSLLTEIRVSDDGLERKERLLGEPFTLDSGGYLIGYTALKSLYHKLKTEYADLDRELFLSYIEAYFFNDFELVRLLLDDNIETLSSGQAIYEYMTERLNNLFACDLLNAIRIYEKYVSQLNGKAFKEEEDFNEWQDELLSTSAKIPGLFLDSDKVYQGLSSYKNAVKRHWENEFNAKKDFLNLMLYKFANREQICIGSLPVDIIVNEHQRALVFHQGSLLLAGALLVEYTAGRYQGAFGIYVSFHNHYKFFAVSIKGKPILIFYSSDPPKMLQEHIRHSIIDRDLLIQLSRFTDETLEDLLRQQPFYDDLQSILTNYYDCTEVLMQQWSLQLVNPGPGFELDGLVKSGIYGLFADDLPAFKTYIEKVNQLSNDIPLSPEEEQELKAIIERVKANTGFDLSVIS